MMAVPGLIGALIGAHLFLVVKLGTTAPPWVKAARPKDARPVEMVPAGVPSPDDDEVPFSENGCRYSDRTAEEPDEAPEPEAAADAEEIAAEGTVNPDPKGRSARERSRKRGVPPRVRTAEEEGQGLLPVRDHEGLGHVPSGRRSTGAMSLLMGAEQGPKADPTTTTYVPRPEWYFFFLFELLRVIKPPALVPLATIGIPTICMVLLLLLPFYDRGPERIPWKRPVASITGVMVIVAMAYLTYLGAVAGSPSEIARGDRTAVRAGQADRRPVGLSGLSRDR